jgi:hypothetical protein
MGRLGSVSRDRHSVFYAIKRPHRESGAIGILFAGFLIAIIGFFVLAIDLSMVYNRRIELQSVADTAALAAAMELNGTSQGVTNAEQKASERFVSGSTGALTVKYGHLNVGWASTAIFFAASKDGPWITFGSAVAPVNAPKMLYVKVETNGLDDIYGQVQTIFLQFFNPDTKAVKIVARAIAGRSGLKVTPLGICAMRPEASRNHNGELEEYGFRRGVSYDLMQQNPDATGSGKTFLVNPMAGTVPITDTGKIAPFVCTGTMAMSRLSNGYVVISSPFPLSSLYYHLNSRFGSYTAPDSACNANSAPPDANIKEYTYNGGSPWMGTVPDGQSAALLDEGGKRWTIVGPDTPSTNPTAKAYGPLWSYAKAVKYAATKPAGGYEMYGTSDWATLYNPGQPTVSTTTPYPTSASTPTPYSYTSGTTFYKAAPAGTKGLRGRRVLNLPLLACPVSGSRAAVLGIGQFFMTVKADDSHVYGEFAGLVPEQSLGAQVELYP